MFEKLAILLALLHPALLDVLASLLPILLNIFLPMSLHQPYAFGGALVDLELSLLEVLDASLVGFGLQFGLAVPAAFCLQQQALSG